ncbi:hypothetical protein H112_03082 [Trichophyton rubrum D6]|uniref:Uncharacterized protein n=3 Tax=Trichophyton TaxID=5550 RepID=A0A080WVA1_TRIRC|nr:uncharacterized protein TERG_05700 [Trichophyton rubrum CBS 118892]EZF24400.1 hypothetical protein H100_03088 [Trichophyton rubrum MR850]EZF43440.1 hypothetical protein H102_03081 [Trichophyton rubrum CBS 100081]EZF54008.1 hypothetical protein H103_03095 [Trichophyton rubrum CBS 288.86]EZF64678.1 hypothetical protein H104_03076 [Trichophyton rubrum CBS 289.86]EZF75324.1 hypothetical protein H105_03100 [Trichophyton soudanense CBS 452.61]EZF85914.1 hypothetical protein H110_03089 [Trichophy
MPRCWRRYGTRRADCIHGTEKCGGGILVTEPFILFFIPITCFVVRINIFSCFISDLASEAVLVWRERLWGSQCEEKDMKTGARDLQTAFVRAA